MVLGGDNSIVQIFADLTGITVHVLPTENLSLEGIITNYRPEENQLDEAAITVVHGGNHFKIAAPTELPSSVTVSIRDCAKVVPGVIEVDGSDTEEKAEPRRKWARISRSDTKEDDELPSPDRKLDRYTSDMKDEAESPPPRRKWERFTRKSQKGKKKRTMIRKGKFQVLWRLSLGRGQHQVVCHLMMKYLSLSGLLLQGDGRGWRS